MSCPPKHNPIYWRFYAQRASATRRGIKFKLTFEQWLAIWKKSKRLPQRGRKKGQFCMARYNDEGAYEIGNVKIISATNNRSEAEPNILSVEGRERISIAITGKPRPDLAAFNKSRAGKPLPKSHRKAIARSLTGKKRGPYKIKGKPQCPSII